MGLDTVEVVMEIEDTFEIAITEGTVALLPFEMVTANDLCELIWQRLQGCEPAWTADDLQRIAVQTVPLRRRTEAYLRKLPRAWWQWRLPQQINRLVQDETLHLLWKELELIWGFAPPPLVPSRDGESFELPASCRTLPGLLGTLIRQWTVQHEPCRFIWKASPEPRPPNANLWTRAAVWNQLQSILMENLFLPQDAVHPDATLSGDLKMD